MNSNLIWQYAVVLLIVAAAVVKIIVGLRKKHSGGKGLKKPSCCGCAISEVCNDKNRPTDKKSAGGKRLTDCDDSLQAAAAARKNQVKEPQ
ncbi:MAG: hypothetical protein K2G75_02160 [Muribaculaceae bacterium]|nr:hypothetical protein [Muribaculaceae bacterium]MDE5924103.1 hypothetical protein [Muribaculaceae bacterium]